jgi:hypothetical protein
MEMKLLTRNFPNVGAIEGQLPEDTVDSLWKLIEESKKEPINWKPELAGNISASIQLNVNSPLIRDFVTNVVGSFIEKNIDSFGPPWRATMEKGQGFMLESLWANFQKKHEFNPPHDHAGVYSFVIWMQIPTSFAEQRELPIAEDSTVQNLISNFTFSYTNTLGSISTFAYNMEKESEGFMVMFPSQLKHQVFPFYENDGERISISGNVTIGDTPV